MTIKITEGGITCVPGFKVSGVHAGFKRKRKDSCIIHCPKGATWAGVFTRNVVKAAPVLLDIDRNRSDEKMVGVMVNSGNANACTGDVGMKDAQETCRLLAEKLGCKEEECLVSSTGVIGVPMDMTTMKKAIDLAYDNLSENGGEDGATAIMTTDTFKKSIAIEFEVDGKLAHMGGMAKGSGMIHPNMGTMLSYITTDVVIEKPILQKALKYVTDRTFNMITVDGDTSTNDSLFIFSSELLKNEIITDEYSEGYEEFVQALTFVCEELAKEIARDGEGATKFVEVVVNNAYDRKEAVQLGKTVATSPLVKTAIFGEDANWGRIICACGYSGIKHLQQEKIDISLSNTVGVLEICKNGMGIPFSEDYAKEILKEKEIEIQIDINQGNDSAKIWTCDFSYDYIKINADYRS